MKKILMEENEYKEIIKILEKGEKDRKLEKYCLEKGKLYKKKKKKKRRIIPRYELEALLYLRHDDPTAGHLGVEKCYEKLKKRYY